MQRSAEFKERENRIARAQALYGNGPRDVSDFPKMTASDGRDLRNAQLCDIFSAPRDQRFSEFAIFLAATTCTAAAPFCALITNFLLCHSGVA